MSRSERVSPTAHATGHFWVRHGLSDPALSTPRGRRLERAFGLFTELTRRLSGLSLEALMLARHTGIDARLESAITDGRIGQVVEIAAGLSGRGLRFCRRHPQLHYLETDLPHMVGLKRQRLSLAGPSNPHHRIEVLDALRPDGPGSLSAVLASLDPTLGTALITEGLMNYLPPSAATSLWQRIATGLERFPQGLYLADAYLMEENRSAAMAAFGAVLMSFVRSRMHVHFASESDALQRLHQWGFTEARLIRTGTIAAAQAHAQVPGGDRVRVLEAWVSPKS